MTKEQKVEAATLHSAMALAFAEIEAATKSADNPFFKSKYADLPSIIAAVKPPLAAHGLFFTQHCHPSETGVIVETVLHHANGDSLSMGSLYVPANKKDPQGFGSAQTYARRYALQTAFGVPVEDDDGNAATKAVNEAPPIEPDPVEDGQVTLIHDLLSPAGKTLSEILGAFKVNDIRKLTKADADKAIKRLEQLGKERLENA